MRNRFLICCLSFFAGCEFHPVYGQVAQIRWDVQQDRPVAYDAIIFRGETVDLMPRLVQGLIPVAVTNAPVEFRYREASLATNQYRSVAGAANTNSGVLAVRWLPDYDAGAAWYDYQFIVGSNAANPRVFGRILMRGTIGLPGPNEPPPPITLYPSRTELQSTSNALAGAVQTLGIAVAGIGSNVVDLAAAVAEIPPPSADAVRLVSTNTTQFIDGDLGVYITTTNSINEAALIMWDSALGAVTLDLIAPKQWRANLGNDLYAYCGDIYQDDIAVYAAVQQTDEWPYGITFYQCDPPGFTDWPKSYNRGDGQTGWVDRVFSPSTTRTGTLVTVAQMNSAIDAATSSISSAWTNSLLYSAAGTNYYPRWDADLSTYVVTGVPQ